MTPNPGPIITLKIVKVMLNVLMSENGLNKFYELELELECRQTGDLKCV